MASPQQQQSPKGKYSYPSFNVYSPSPPYPAHVSNTFTTYGKTDPLTPTYSWLLDSGGNRISPSGTPPAPSGTDANWAFTYTVGNGSYTLYFQYASTDGSGPPMQYSVQITVP